MKGRSSGRLDVGFAAFAVFTAVVVAVLALGFAPCAARAQPTPIDLHVDIGGGAPIVGDDFRDDAADEVPGAGFVATATASVSVIGDGYFMGVEVLGGGGTFGAPYATAAAGVRFGTARSYEDAASHGDGGLGDDFWLAFHVGYHFFDESQFGIDASIGYEWAVARPLAIGLFAHGALLLGGRHSSLDAVLDAGVSFRVTTNSAG